MCMMQTCTQTAVQQANTDLVLVKCHANLLHGFPNYVLNKISVVMLCKYKRRTFAVFPNCLPNIGFKALVRVAIMTVCVCAMFRIEQPTMKGSGLLFKIQLIFFLINL